MTYFIFRSWNQNLSFFIDPFISFLFGGLVLLGVLFIVTTFWKISLHSASISGLAGGSMALLLLQKEAYNVDVMMGVNSLLLFSIGLVSFSRLKLNVIIMVSVGRIFGWVHHHVYDCYKSVVYLPMFFISVPISTHEQVLQLNYI